MRTILIVDDEATVRYATRRALEHKFRIVEADGAATARIALQQEQPSVVLLDIVMPGEDGLSFLRWMREAGHGQPVIMLTALDMAQTAVEALRQGAADYLVKGCDISELRARVENAVRLVEAQQENERLTAQLAKEQKRREWDLVTASALQSALLPRISTDSGPLEIVARYVAAHEIGGDLYEFTANGPGECAFALGDVTGKGAAAALFGAVVLGTMRSLAPLKLPPAQMLARVNQLLCGHEIRARFVTLCFATWNTARQELRVANAGQTQPLVVRGGRCEKIPLEGLPAGIFADATYDEWATQLAPGDWVIFHSDGITESLNAAEEQFGLERLCMLLEQNAKLEASALADRVLQAVEDFAPGKDAADDRTLLIAKIRRTAQVLGGSLQQKGEGCEPY